eukprot:1160186-Pelagomonas_calceolata.AAC.9
MARLVEESWSNQAQQGVAICNAVNSGSLKTTVRRHSVMRDQRHTHHQLGAHITRGCQYPCNKRTRVAGILGLLFTAALPHYAAQHLLSTHDILSFGAWFARPAPLCPPPGHREGIGRGTRTLSFAWFT